ncbi:MAG: hormogonium polysaccharide biosynthesis protein HpsA [Leptolyngbyaceae cyanobacterium]
MVSPLILLTLNFLQASHNTLVTILKRFITGCLGLLFSLRGRSPRRSASRSASRSTVGGFILPTTVMLLLVVSLAVSMITLRSYNRSQAIIGERSEQVIYNLATPAIDRAKAKLEYLFRRDSRFPSGLPGEGILTDLLAQGSDILANVEDAYTFPGETRIDVNDDDKLDAGWKYRVDIDDDGADDATVGYSIVLGTPSDPAKMVNSSDAAIQERADALQVRHAPLSGAASLADACQLQGGAENGIPIEQGWFQDPTHSAILRKNFQVDVYVLPDDSSISRSTLEFHQDRQMTRGNKWAAWFRNDLEIFPGPLFNWNGAMHTEGNLVVGNKNFNGYLISSPFSCLYSRDSAEVTVADVAESPNDDIPAFQGQFISGKVNKNSFGSSGSDKSRFHLFDTRPITSGNDTLLDLNRDSVVNNGPKPGDYALDPILLVTQDVSASRKVSGGDPSPHRDGNWKNRAFVDKGRLVNRSQDPPYVDDFYRADNRYGPKPRYKEKLIPGTIGEPIMDDRLAAVSLDDTTLTREYTDDIIGLDSYGLDGYWERRARAEGLRLVTSQRLELGNTFGWQSAQDPLYPANDCPSDRCHETLQRRTLRDNLAAVQSLAIYHQGRKAIDRGEFPIACYALTAHPGTAQTIKNSRTFANSQFSSGVDIDFLRGQGVNGWEFAPPSTSADEFAKAIAPDQPLGRALRNLAYFAGDPKGGSPSFPPFQDDEVHPYSHLNMWGDFSILRRVFSILDKQSYNQGNPYGSPSFPDMAATDIIAYKELSPADQATLHSAACTLGMLAYDLDSLEQLNVDADPTTRNQLATALTNAAGSLSTDATPEAFLHQIADNGASAKVQELGRRVMEREQAERDRRFGFLAGGQVSIGAGDEQTLFDYFENDLDGGGSTEPWLKWLSDWTISPSSNNSRVRTIDDLGDDSLRIQRIADGFTVSRSTDLSGLFNATLSFDYRRKISWIDEYIDIEISNNGGASFTQLQRFPGYITDSNYRSFSIDISDYISPETIIRFTSDSGRAEDSDYFWVDNLKIVGNEIDIDGDSSSVSFTSVNCQNWSNGLENLCTDYPKFPSLYYLFPVHAHNHIGTQPQASDWDVGTTVTEVLWDDQPDGEEYVAAKYIFDSSSTAGANDNYIYQVLEDQNADGIENGTDDGLAEIAIQPRSLNLTDWITPTATSGSNLIYDSTGQTLAAIPFLDKGIFNGREMMSVRVLDIDLELMRTSNKNLGKNVDDTGIDHWFPDSGIVYAAREDAVREDSILRPHGVSGTPEEAWATCGHNATFEKTSGPSNSKCRMEADPNKLQDPPLNPKNMISPKSVDYYPDPDRRPHGFRIRNGTRLDRSSTNPRGLSLISDQPVYIQGNFNLHQTYTCNNSESCRLEEFKTKLNSSNYSNFYKRSDLDVRFARPKTDLWRTSEFLADAVTITSQKFCDGSIEDTFNTAGQSSNAKVTSSKNSEYKCSGNSQRTSYLNQNRPKPRNNNSTPPEWKTPQWKHEDPDDVTSPVLVSRNGHPVIADGREYSKAEYANNDFYRFRDGKPLINESTQRVNAIIISGLVPSRKDQSYGGLHNFPRFISKWPTLHISGSLLQLNFSNYATAPFDQDAWETDENASGSREDIKYYSPPNRRWGYDVGLQYVPAGPIAQRFVTVQHIRSEFYSEPASNDPYMVNLCRQIADDPDSDC